MIYEERGIQKGWFFLFIFINFSFFLKKKISKTVEGKEIKLMKQLIISKDY